MNLKRILFSGDAFRNSGFGPGQKHNVLWLAQLIEGVFRDITAIDPEVVFPLTGDTAEDFLALQGSEIGLESWARTFWAEPTSDLIAALKASCEGALVVTFEMPPVMQSALGAARIPWIDISLSPLRFLADWAFHVRASNHFNLRIRPDLLLLPSDIQTAVDHVTRWYGTPEFAEPVLVFFSQTNQDRSLILDGRFCGPQDALAGLAALGSFRRLLVKPHPWQGINDVAAALIDHGAEVTDAATYALLSSPMVEAATLSSSVGREALAFGRRAHIMSPSVVDWAYSGVTVLQSALSPTWWGALLASGNIDVKPGVEPEWMPNRIRETVNGQGLDLAVWANSSPPQAR